ncbi:hypothetical protein [Agrococcus casei]|uniref:HEPN domain-containing protein n=1 Tax=Agrococcus casei LMG 22410 TaxID=1255656 RepID=A0A1R4ET54_9MICO|nr:hypothetical protein [Agrococcus casei]SJM46739.1 hypothetical protein CZ674_00710 [Agrococcus casei LMG 22410]
MTPKSDSVKTVSADKAVRAGRLAKARQFLQVADDAIELADETDVADAAATLYIHAGIAAADAICAAALGKHAKGQDHQQAVTLLASTDREASKWLNTLLTMKTRAGYGHDPTSDSALRRLQRAAQSLVNRALT